MRVAAWSNGTGAYGISVGAGNRERYSCCSWPSIEVEIGGRSLEFRLTDSFWCDCPEFRGHEIKDWLAARGFIPWPNGHPPAFELIPLGGNRFRLDEQAAA
jgi:hypothetical protein